MRHFLNDWELCVGHSCLHRLHLLYGPLVQFTVAEGFDYKLLIEVDYLLGEVVASSEMEQLMTASWA